MVKRKGTICVKALRHIQDTDMRPVWADLPERGGELCEMQMEGVKARSRRA